MFRLSENIRNSKIFIDVCPLFFDLFCLIFDLFRFRSRFCLTSGNKCEWALRVFEQSGCRLMIFSFLFTLNSVVINMHVTNHCSPAPWTPIRTSVHNATCICSSTFRSSKYTMCALYPLKQTRRPFHLKLNTHTR